MSAGNDFWACRAGVEYLAAVNSIAKEMREQNKLLATRNEALERNNRLLEELIENIKYLR